MLDRGLEGAITSEFPIQAAIGDKGLMNQLTDLGNPWVDLPLKLWNKLTAKYHLKEVIKVLRWCAFDPDFMPKNLV